jgi:THO complex subunit 5
MAAPRGTLDDLKVILADLRACAERLAAVGPGKADDPTFLAAKTDASLAFLKIRAVNRDVLNDLEKTRERTSAHKTELDEARLQLQNVLYEKLHIQKEIRACEDFTSAYSDEEIGLRDVKEFMEREGIKEGELDPHELMLKRLSSELAERKALCEEEKELKVRRESFIIDRSRDRDSNRFVNPKRLASRRVARRSPREKTTHPPTPEKKKPQAKRKRLQDGIDERRKFLDGLGAQLESLKRATAPLQARSHHTGPRTTASAW